MPTSRAPELSAENLTDYRLERIEQAVGKMAESMQNLVALEQKHSETREALGRAFEAQDKDRERIRQLELKMAVVQQSSGWLSQSIAIGATALVTGVVTIVLPHIMK